MFDRRTRRLVVSVELIRAAAVVNPSTMQSSLSLIIGDGGAGDVGEWRPASRSRLGRGSSRTAPGCCA